MLKIIPDSISNEAPGGEKKFFNLIKGSADQLKNWTVFWDTQIDIHNYKKDGQCDFIFLGPSGLFVIEVKGGDHYECINGIHRWGWINSKIPLNEKRESPLNQAKGNLYSIENYLKSRIDPESFKVKSLFTAYGVAHPEADLSNIKGDVEFNPIQIFHKESDQDVLKYLRNLEKYFKEEKFKNKTSKLLSKTEINLIRRHLKSNFKCVTNKEATNEDNEEILRLEGEQRVLLDYVDAEADCRLLIEGQAGTGKTVVAKMITENFTLYKKRVLWISFNRLFTEQIKKFFRDITFVEVLTSSQLMIKYIKESGEDVLRKDSELEKKFIHSLSQLDPKQYDVLVVDEAQDILTTDFLLGLDKVVKGGLKKGSWAILYDKHLQSKVFDKLEDEALEMLKEYSTNFFKLKKNRRNARNIVKDISKRAGVDPPECLRETPGEIIIKDCSKFSIKDKHLRIENILVDIFKEEPNAVLLSSRSEKNFLNEVVNSQYLSSLGGKNRFYLVGLRGRNQPLTTSSKFDYTPIKFTSIHAFKGLERDCIILHWSKEDLEENPEKNIHLLYTAFTRALNKVYLVLSKKVNEAAYYN